MFIEMGGMYNINGEKHFGRKIFTEVSNIKNIRKKFNNIDVYATVYLYDNEKQSESNLFGPLYIDMDMDNIEEEENLKKLQLDLKLITKHLNLNYGIPTESMQFFFTGKKGFHILINPKVFGIRPCKHLNEYFKEIAKELNLFTIYKEVDTRIYDYKRLLRLPNSINSKSGLYKVPISFEDATNFTYEELKEYAKTPQKIVINEITKIEKAANRFNNIVKNYKEKKSKKKVIKSNVDIRDVKFLPCITSLLINGASKGNRNNSTVILASAFFQEGISYYDALNVILQWNSEKNDPSLNETEVEATVQSAYENVQAGRCYGCTSIQDMSLCTQNCNLYR